MKRTALKFIIFVIIPVITLIGISLYFIFKIPQIKYGFTKYITKRSLEKKVQKGEISRSNAMQLEKAFDRLIEVSIKVDRKVKEGQIDREKMEQELEEWSKSHQNQFSGPEFGLPDNDEEAEKAIFILNEVCKIMEKHVKNIPEQP